MSGREAWIGASASNGTSTSTGGRRRSTAPTTMTALPLSSLPSLAHLWSRWKSPTLPNVAVAVAALAMINVAVAFGTEAGTVTVPGVDAAALLRLGRREEGVDAATLARVSRSLACEPSRSRLSMPNDLAWPTWPAHCLAGWAS